MPVANPPYVNPYDRGRVCFTWDDGTLDHATIVKPLADSLGQSHTFCINTGTIDNLNGATNRMSTAQVQALSAAGHEIADHGNLHTDWTTLTTAQRDTYFAASAAWFAANLPSATIRTFCYPFGTRSQGADNGVYGRYARALDIQPGTPYELGHNPDFLVRRFNWDVAHHQQILNMLAWAAAKRATIVVMAHAVDAVDASAPTTAQVQEVLALATSLGLNCWTVTQAFGDPNVVPDPGFEDTTLANWRTVVTGTGTVTNIADAPATGLSGVRSCRMSTTDLVSTAFVRHNTLFPIVGGATYTMTARVRRTLTAGSDTAIIRFQEFREDIGVATVTTSSTAIASGTWAQASASIATNQNSRFLQIEAGIAAGMNGDLYVDHIDVRRNIYGNYLG